MSKLAQVGRVALREEGKWWVAYYATADTMKDAIEIGRIRMAGARIPEAKDAFIQVCRLIIGTFLRDALGVAPEWKEPVTAPESERSGHA